MGLKNKNKKQKMKFQIFSGIYALAQGYSTQGYFWSNGAPATYSWTDRFGNGMTGWTRSFWNKNRMPRRQMSVNWQQNDNDWNNWMNTKFLEQKPNASSTDECQLATKRQRLEQLDEHEVSGTKTECLVDR